MKIRQVQHLNRIYGRLFSTRPQSMAVIGDWQTGKSTLLRQLINPSVYEAFKPEAVEPLFFLYDIGSQFKSWEQLLEEMSSDLIAATAEQHANVAEPNTTARSASCSTGNPYQVFQELVVSLHEKYYLYVLFDNFELLTQNPEVPLEFYSYLRSLANSYRIAYVTTSHGSLQSLCVRQDICESPFFNIFTNLELKGFSEVETAELIAAYGISADPKQGFKLCGGHPGLTVKWLEFAQNGGKEPEDFIAASSEYLNKWFAQFDADTAEVLKASAQRTAIPAALKFLEVTLRRKGYLDAEGCVSAEAFRSYLQGQIKPEKKGFFKQFFKK